MDRARDIMEPAAVVGPSMGLRDLAEELLATGAEAVCVVEDERLVGVLTGMDLVYREKVVSLPVTITVLDLVLQLGTRRTERELERVSALTVGELMTREVVTVTPDTRADELATRMVERKLSLLPVVDGERLVGVVTRQGMVQLALRHLLRES